MEENRNRKHKHASISNIISYYSMTLYYYSHVGKYCVKCSLKSEYLCKTIFIPSLCFPEIGLMPLGSQESSDSLAAEIVTPEIK